MYSNTASFVSDVDQAFLFIVGVSVALLVLITVLMVVFVVKYHKRRHPRPEKVKDNLLLEIAWTVIPTLLVLAMFYYGLSAFRIMRTVPKDAFTVKVVGQMWQWRFEYPNGKQSEYLHVPYGKPVKLLLSSSDVIHSFYVPAFRVKQDAVPGMETYLWFEPTALGEFDAFCAEYCGLQHSSMITKVIVKPREEFDQWYETVDVEPQQSTQGEAAGPVGAATAGEEPDSITEQPVE